MDAIFIGQRGHVKVHLTPLVTTGTTRTNPCCHQEDASESDSLVANGVLRVTTWPDDVRGRLDQTGCLVTARAGITSYVWQARSLAGSSVAVTDQ